MTNPASASSTTLFKRGLTVELPVKNVAVHTDMNSLGLIIKAVSLRMQCQCLLDGFS